MTISEILQRVAEYHPNLGTGYQGCDGVKIGDPNKECTGIVSALVPTVDVIRKTAALGCNLLYVHEPTSYLTPDPKKWNAGFDCHIYDQKIQLLNDNGIVVYRDHDHMHAHQPDSIFAGVIKYLGWEEYLKTDEPIVPYGYLIEFPESRTVKSLNMELITKIGMNGLRYVGRPDTLVKRLALVGHIYPGAFIPESYTNGVYNDYATELIRIMEQNAVDAIMPGEVIEWTILSYIRDAISFGEDKACFNLGHFNWEQLGARYAVDWLGEIVHYQVPITYIETGDLWNYQIK